MVGIVIRDATTRLSRAPDVARSASKAVAVTGQYASTVPVDANGRADGTVPHVARHPRADRRPRGHRRAGPGLQPAQDRALRAPHRGRTVDSRRRPDRPHPLPHERPSPSSCARTRWFLEPVDYLTMRFERRGVGDARLAPRACGSPTIATSTAYAYDERLLAHRRPRRRQPAAARPLRVGRRPRVTPDVADDLGLSRDTVVVTGMPDLHAGGARLGGDGALRRPTSRSRRRRGSAARSPRRRPTSLHSIATVPGLTNDSYLDDRQPGDRRRRRSSGCATCSLGGQPLTTTS